MSEFFTDAEMDCPCGKCPGGKMQVPFMDRLDKLRRIFGHPLQITSGFRCAAHNKEVGGSPSSLHLQGRAADISVISDADRYQLLRIAVSIFGGVGIGRTFIHVDDRPTAQRCWVY